LDCPLEFAGGLLLEHAGSGGHVEEGLYAEAEFGAAKEKKDFSTESPRHRGGERARKKD
jgi:hypothetical protein